MKKSFFRAILMAVISLAAMPSLAQKHELYVSYGFWPSANVPDYDNLPVMESPWSPDGAMVSPLVNNVKASGGFTIGYMQKFSPMVSVGLSYTHRSIKRDFGFLEGDPAGRIKSGSNIFMLNCKLEWLHARDFHLYSRAGVGLQFIGKGSKMRLDGINRELYDMMHPQSQTNLAWQMSVVGAEWRFLDDALAIFGELGVGQQGALQVGAKTFF